ncbi:outer membrane lipoprotein carrier protein LolA [uncultured Rikenella sp.]|uniref:LolA family protein n=1 Tax=uncultured Rikenella sp. TaxID=368003 RepID=UPI0026176AE5|nr:outer membrane lipoprotein carrier protein LolA [uncultured Rikenella sp.]
MKKLLLTGLLSFIAGQAAADGHSEALLGKLREKVRSFTSYKLDFTAAVEGDGTVEGNLVVSGRRFAAKVRGQELYYDGKTLWNYIPGQREVTIERLDPNNPSVLSNPPKLMNIDPQDYNHRSLPSHTTAKGKVLQVVELTPKVATPDYTSMTLYIDPATSLPERISIVTPSSEQPVELHVGNIRTGVPVTESTFRFDAAAHPGTEVIDFR